MTLFNLSKPQKEFLLESLFDYNIMKKLKIVPTHIMYYADKHEGTAGILFLRKDTQGSDYKVTATGMAGFMIPMDATLNMIDYMDSKTFTMLPTHVYKEIESLIKKQAAQ